MPFQIGSVAVHDDGQHSGSAKRDTANGVAGLDGSGNLIVPAGDLRLHRNGTNDITVVELTSSEVAAYIRRAAATDYDGFILESGAAKQIQTESMKNAANGIAGLDAQMLIGSPILSAFNLLKIYNGGVNANFVETKVGTGDVIENLAAGTVQVTAPANDDDAKFWEADKIALSALPRIAVYKVNSITVNGGSTALYMGFSDGVPSHFAGIQTLDGGTNWTFTTTGAASTSNAIAAPAAGDVYVIYCTSTRCALFRNGAHVVTNIANIPTNAVGHGVQLITAAAQGAGSQITLGFMG